MLVELKTIKPVAVTSLFLLRLINTISVKIACFPFYSFWLRWVFVAVFRLSRVAASRGTQGSVVVAHGLWLLQACGILVPQPEIKLMSPALAGGFLTTGSPGRVQCVFLIIEEISENLLPEITEGRM